MDRFKTTKSLPSANWTSFEGWDYNGMKERLERCLASVDKDMILRHAELVKCQKLCMSQSFSAGQYWICFEMVAEDGSLVIARVRLPRHPETLPTVTEEDEFYAIACEVSTMRFIRQQNLPSVVVPEVYAYEGPNSGRAAAAGAIYMLIEGFYGNNLLDLEPDICSLPSKTQDHIFSQWTSAQAQLATLAYPSIGSITAIDNLGEPIIGKLSTAAADGVLPQGPFSTAIEYFTAIGEAALRRIELDLESGNDSHDSVQFSRLGAFVFLDIIQKTDLFEGPDEVFPLNHMDLGTQNIIVDNEFNFLGIIDWEFAQTAPWQVNYYPMPFPLLEPNEEINVILEDTKHLAHKNVMKQHSSRKSYYERFQEAGDALGKEGTVESKLPGVLEGPASRIYACFNKLGNVPEQDLDYVRTMVSQAFGYDGQKIDQYIEDIRSRVTLN